MKLTSIRKNYDDFIALLGNLGINPEYNKYVYDREFFADNKILAEHILGDLIGADHNRSIDQNVMREVLRNNSKNSYNTDDEINAIITKASSSLENFNAIVNVMITSFEQSMVEPQSVPVVNDVQQYKMVSVIGEANQYEHYSHFAIHKETNSIAWSYDYDGMYPVAPKPPVDKTNKGAKTRYLNNLENFKYITKDVNAELNSNKETYFFIDLRDNIAPNYNNEKDFKLSDFVIVAKNNLKKYNIDLNNFNAFYGENQILEPTQPPILDEVQSNIVPVDTEVSATGRIYVHTEIKTENVFNPNGGMPLQENKRDICISETGVVIGEKRTQNIPDAQSMYYLVSDFGTGYYNIDDLEDVYFQYIDLAEHLEKEVSSICRIAKNENEALTETSKLVYPKESSKMFFKKYFEVYNVYTPQEVIIQFFKNVNGIPDETQPSVETTTVIEDVFQGENPFPYGIDSAGNRIQFSETDVDSDGWLVASYKDLVAFIAPFSFNMHLDVSNNNLHTLELLGNFNGMLNCSNNKLTSLKLPYRYNNYLNCSKNQLKEINLTNHFNSELDCSFNLISILDLTECKHFDRALNCNNNIITVLNLPNDFNNYLNASYNLLKHYNVPENYNSHLNLSNNQLETLTFSGYFDAPLDVSNNMLSDLKLPDGYNMNNFKGFMNFGEVTGFEKKQTETVDDSNKDLLSQNVSQKEHKDGLISMMLTANNVNEIISKFTEGFVSQLNKARIEPSSEANNENIAYLENQIKVSAERAMKMYNIANEIYTIMVSGGVPIKKNKYKIGDEVLFVTDSGDKTVTEIEDIFTPAYGVEEVYVIKKVDGIFDQNVSYDSLRPLN